MLTIQSLKAKNIITFVALLLGISLPLLFMNCSLDEGDTVRKSSIPLDYTENPKDFPDPDIDNSKIVWPNGLNVGEWQRTSQISSIDIRVNSGQVSIIHTKAGQWKQTENVGSASVEDPVEGNAWIIVPLNGKGYAAPYDWIGESDPDHMLDVGNLDGFYQQLPSRAGVPELSNWAPIPGDRIGFLVSGLAKNGLENVKERSNMLVFTLPDKDGNIPPEACSQNAETVEGTNIPICPDSCETRNRITIIENLSQQNSDALSKAIQFNQEKMAGGSVENGDERWEFMDRVVKTLHSTDDDFGYTCNGVTGVSENCNDISTNTIAYKCRESSGTSTSTTIAPSVNETIITVEILSTSGALQWEPSDPDSNQQNGWTYPRPEAEDTPPSKVGPGGDVTPPVVSECSSGDGSSGGATKSQLDVVRKVAAATGDLYKTGPAEFTQRVAECLKDIDSNWGRRDDSGVVPDDIVAYLTEGSEVPYSIDIIVDGAPAWNIANGSGQCGQVGGTWSKVEGNCIVELEGHCTIEQRDSGNYGTVDGKCYPTCESFEDTNAQGVEIATGDDCSDTTNYNTLPIKNTYEEKKESQQCCRRSGKRTCVTGYSFLTDNCYPTCAQAAKLKGYNSSSYYEYSNGNAVTEFFTVTTSDCEDLSEDEDDHWTDFTFYDPYRLKSSSSTEDISICKLHDCPERRGCCVKMQVAPSDEEFLYDSNGWSKADRDRLPNSSSSTNPSGAGTCRNDSDCRGGNGLQTCSAGRCVSIGFGNDGENSGTGGAGTGI